MDGSDEMLFHPSDLSGGAVATRSAPKGKGKGKGKGKVGAKRGRSASRSAGSKSSKRSAGKKPAAKRVKRSLSPASRAARDAKRAAKRASGHVVPVATLGRLLARSGLRVTHGDDGADEVLAQVLDKVLAEVVGTALKHKQAETDGAKAMLKTVHMQRALSDAAVFGSLSEASFRGAASIAK